MLKSYQRFKTLNKDKYKIPKSVQDMIPIDTIYHDGIFRIGNRYSKTYRFDDINYKIASNEDKNTLLMNYGELLNSFDSSVMIKISVNNRKIDLDRFSKDTLMKLKQDENDLYRKEYNQILLNNLAESDHIIQEKYITVTAFKNSIQEARTFFNRISGELTNNFVKLGSACKELDIYERLKILHDFYRGTDDLFTFDMNDSLKKGHSFKEHITPRYMQYHHDHFAFEGKVGRVLYLSSYGNFISDEIVSVLTSLNKNLIYSMDIFGIPKDEAVKEVQDRLASADTNRYTWGQKQIANNNFVSEVPYEIKRQIESCNELLDDIVTRDQKMFLCNITLVHLADSKEELDEDTEKLKAAAAGCSCELSILYFSERQKDGLLTCLPIGINKLENMYRTLLTQSASTFIPFRAQQLMHPQGIWYGKNTITNSIICINKSVLQNANTFILGVPGSGKSFISKLELEAVILNTDDDILIADPEGEYNPIIKELGGEIIEIGTNSNDHINAMDMSEGYGDSNNSIGAKSQYVMSIFEELTKEEGLTSMDRSIIDRCVMLTYKESRKKKSVPTLKTLREILLKQPEQNAQELAVKLELLTEGSLNVFAHETNVDTNNRIISFNMFKLEKTLKRIGLLVITDAILNRVNQNWKKGKRTHIFIDEIHIIFEHEESANFFASAWRQFRKRNAYPTAITQNVSYLLDSQQGISMLSNSEFIIMLNQSPSDRTILGNLLRISEEQMKYIENAQTGSGLIKFKSYLVPFINNIPKDYELYKLNNTKSSEI